MSKTDHRRQQRKHNSKQYPKRAERKIEKKKQVESEHDSAEEIICGRNALKAALASGRSLNRIYYLESGDRRLQELVSSARAAGVLVSPAQAEQLERLAGGLTHQGIIAELAAKDYCDAEALLAELEAKGISPFVLVLAEIQDGHNLGAILRVADAAGVDLVVIPERRSQALDARVARASAGAIEFVPVARVTNLSRFIRDLKERAYWTYALAGEGDELYNELSYRGKIALVVGNEAKGINQKLKEHCDFLVKIPMQGKINSLNAAVACGIVSFAAQADRSKASAEESKGSEFKQI